MVGRRSRGATIAVARRRYGAPGLSARRPDVSVVIPSHDRPLRLLWLLNALEAQDLDRERFEVIVVHDSRGPETEAILRDHPLAAAGVLRHETYAPGSASPSEKRNAGWQAARADLIAFTDDDCEPAPGWLRALVEAAPAFPGTILQGTTRPQPAEAHLLTAVRHARSQSVDPPDWYAQTCNVAYPREVLETVGGFRQLGPVPAGEDTDLYLRCRDRHGVPLAAVPHAVVFHAVEPMTLRGHLRFVRRWEHLAAVVREHPGVRDTLYLRVFWRRSHALLLLALAGAGAARAFPVAAALGLPWLLAGQRTPKGIARALFRAPERAALDLTEIAVLARGSARYRTLYL